MQGDALPRILRYRLACGSAARSQQETLGLPTEGEDGTTHSASAPAMYALQAMLQKKHAKSEYVFHQADGFPWKSILESFRSLLKRCGFKRSGVHILWHTFGAHLAQKGVDMAMIRDLIGHHSVTLTEKYKAHLAPSLLASAVQRLDKKENLLPKANFAPFSGTKNGDDSLPSWSGRISHPSSKT